MDRVEQAVERANQGLNRVKIVGRGRKLSLHRESHYATSEGIA